MVSGTSRRLGQMAKSSASSRKRLDQADSSKPSGSTGDLAVSPPIPSSDLLHAVEGNLSAFAAIASQSQQTIRQLRAAHGDLVLTCDAVRKVLEDLQAGRITPEKAQRWASFVRRGYVAGN